MPDFRSPSTEAKIAHFIGGPLDGEEWPLFTGPLDYVLKSTVVEDGSRMSWHWYALAESDAWDDEWVVYRFVTSETGDWPSDFCPRED